MTAALSAGGVSAPASVTIELGALADAVPVLRAQESQGDEEPGTEGVVEEEQHEFQAPHSWLPETQEIIWGSLAFFIVLGVLIKYAGPAVRKGLAARTDRIAKEMDDATRSRADAERRAADIRTAKGDIAAERARIEAEADATAERVLVEGRGRLETEVAELEARADAEIAGAGGRLSAELQSQVATLSLTTAERVVNVQLDAATQAELVERFIARVGASGPNGDTSTPARGGGA